MYNYIPWLAKYGLEWPNGGTLRKNDGGNIFCAGGGRISSIERVLCCNGLSKWTYSWNGRYSFDLGAKLSTKKKTIVNWTEEKNSACTMF